MTAVHLAPLDDVGQALVTTAARLLAHEGASALTVRRIAGETGISTMNVYSRFGGKNGVVEQLFLQGFGLLADAMRRTPPSGDPVADLRACGDGYRQFALEHPTLYAVMFEHAVPDYEPSAHALASGLDTLQQLADRVQRCIDAGVFRSGPALHFAAIVWATCHGVVSLELRAKLSGSVDWAGVYRDACDNLIRGLRSDRH